MFRTRFPHIWWILPIASSLLQLYFLRLNINEEAQAGSFCPQPAFAGHFLAQPWGFEAEGKGESHTVETWTQTLQHVKSWNM